MTLHNAPLCYWHASPAAGVATARAHRSGVRTLEAITICCLLAFSPCAPAQRAIDTAAYTEYPVQQIFEGLWSWAHWLPGPDAPTVRVVGSSRAWSDAAHASPAAAFHLAALKAGGEAVVAPLSINPGDSFSCGRRLATPAAVLEAATESLDQVGVERLMPELRPNELYRVVLETEYSEGVPATLHFRTEWFMVPYKLLPVGQLTVAFEPTPLHWVPIAFSGQEAPVMRISAVSGWQTQPGG